ncbi:MAG TPA: EF-hand domain-containing protein [Roseimicrobium sp.]|nr:EF-hand domain-containing protein [Roseimicrobium sp.]
MFPREFCSFACFGLLLSGIVHAGPATENAAAQEYRKHLEAADTNRDGFVSREELVVEIAKSSKRDPATVEKMVDAMIRSLDTDKDAKLSATEIDAGARKVGENYVVQQNVRRAKVVMEALAKYKTDHGGATPVALEGMVKIGLAPEEALRCIMADGNEKAWGYTRPQDGKAAPGDVVIYSQGGVDSAGQYVVGLNDGSVAGLHDGDEALGKVPGAKVRIQK